MIGAIQKIKKLNMKKLNIFFILIIFIFHNSLQAYSADPKDFVKELVTDAIEK